MRNRRDEYLEDQEEHFQTMRDRLQMAAGMSNFFSVVLGVVVILLLVLLIVSLINWLSRDISTTFTAINSRF